MLSCNRVANAIIMRCNVSVYTIPCTERCMIYMYTTLSITYFECHKLLSLLCKYKPSDIPEAEQKYCRHMISDISVHPKSIKQPLTLNGSSVSAHKICVPQLTWLSWGNCISFDFTPQLRSCAVISIHRTLTL